MIRLFFLFISIITFQIEGKCDTIANWQIYHNENLIAELNIFNKESEVIILKEKLKLGDSITVNYFKDTPCFNCPSNLSFEDSNGNLISIWNGQGTFTPKKFLIDTLLKSKEENFNIWYDEGKMERQLLFVININ